MYTEVFVGFLPWVYLFWKIRVSLFAMSIFFLISSLWYVYTLENTLDPEHGQMANGLALRVKLLLLIILAKNVGLTTTRKVTLIFLMKLSERKKNA